MDALASFPFHHRQKKCFSTWPTKTPAAIWLLSRHKITISTAFVFLPFRRLCPVCVFLLGGGVFIFQEQRARAGRRREETRYNHSRRGTVRPKRRKKGLVYNKFFPSFYIIDWGNPSKQATNWWRGSGHTITRSSPALPLTVYLFLTE